MDLDDLILYRRAMALSDSIWKEVHQWPAFAQSTIGEQLVRAADSITANLSEGHGRFHHGERKLFCFYSRGSLQETLTWIKKARSRDLLSEETSDEMVKELTELRKMLNGYIRFLNRQSRS